jgi:putative phosphoribosyl transferase
MHFKDRRQAGTVLGKTLLQQLDVNPNNTVVLGLARGGVPVACEVARQLKAPLDVLLVRKIGVPFNPEVAMGAIASGGVVFLNHGLIQRLRLSEEEIEPIIQKEWQTLTEREKRYRGDRAPLNLTGKTVILVDDGLATGASMMAAVNAVKTAQPTKIIIAAPVAPPEVVHTLKQQVDEVVVPLQPVDFSAVGQWYEDFAQTSDEEVIACLQQA